MDDAGTLGLPAGLPSDSFNALTPSFDVGEVGVTDGASLVSSTSHIVRWANREMTRAESEHVSRWREQAAECYRFRDNHQLSKEDEAILRAARRPDTAINEVQKFIKFASGIERRTPTALIFMSRNAEDQQSAGKGELITKLAEWFCDQSMATYWRSMAFEDKLVTGMGWVDIGVSRATDAAGLPRYKRIEGKQMLWPETDSINLDGVKWLARESFMDVEEAIHKWSDQAIFLRTAAGGAVNEDQFPDFGYGAKRPIPYVVPWIMTAPLNRSSGGASTSKPGKVPICEFQFYQDDLGYYFFDPIERDDTWLSLSEYRKYQARLLKLGAGRIKDFDKQNKRIYKRMFLLQRRIMLDAPTALPTNDNYPGFTFNCMTGTWDQEDHVFYGIMRVMMSPQKYANAFFRQVLEVMGSATKGGYLAETGAITPAHKKDIEETGARAGSVNMVQPGAISGGKITPKPIPQIPAGSMEVLGFCLDTIEKVAGLSTSMLGTDQGNVPGVSLRRRLTSGMVILAAEFDSLSWFRKREGEIIYSFTKLMADERWVRVGGPDDSMFVQLAKEPFALRYDVVLDENDQDPNLRQWYADSLIQLAPILIRTGNFLPDMLDYVPLPVKFRQKLKQQMAQQEQQKMQMAMQGANVGGRGKPRSPAEAQAQLQLTQAKVGEHMARAQKTMVEAKLMPQASNRDNAKAMTEMLLNIFQAQHDKNLAGMKAWETAAKAFGPQRGTQQ